MSALEWVLTIALVITGLAAVCFAYLFWWIAKGLVDTINSLARRR